MKEKELQNDQLTFIDEEGNEILCQVLFTFHSDDFKKDYVLFYPVGQEQNEEQIDVMAASYVAEQENGTLEPVNTDEEWDMIEDMLERYEESLDEAHEHSHDHDHHHHHDHSGCCEGEECEGEECDCEDGECEEGDEACCCHKEK